MKHNPRDHEIVSPLVFLRPIKQFLHRRTPQEGKLVELNSRRQLFAAVPIVDGFIRPSIKVSHHPPIEGRR